MNNRMVRILSNGKTYCGGFNTDGMASTLNLFTFLEPCGDPVLETMVLKDIEVGHVGTLALDTNGTLYLFDAARVKYPREIGRNIVQFSYYKDMLTYLTQDQYLVTLKVPFDNMICKTFVAQNGIAELKQSLDATYYISADRRQLFARGMNNYGELGVGSMFCLFFFFYFLF